jgi:hypothetical protein
MIKVTIGQNMKRYTIYVDENAITMPDGSRKAYDHEVTLRDAVEAVEFDTTKGSWTMDGAPLGPGDINRTFTSYGVTSSTALFSVVKMDNA